MSEDTQPAVAPAPVKTRRRRSLLNQRHAAALLLAGEIAGTAEKPAYAAALATEGIDAAFVTDLCAKIAEANALAAAAEGRTADRKVATQSEDALRANLLALVSLVQSRAKRKYKAPIPCAPNISSAKTSRSAASPSKAPRRRSSSISRPTPSPE